MGVSKDLGRDPTIWGPSYGFGTSHMRPLALSLSLSLALKGSSPPNSGETAKVD